MIYMSYSKERFNKQVSKKFYRGLNTLGLISLISQEFCRQASAGISSTVSETVILKSFLSFIR